MLGDKPMVIDTRRVLVTGGAGFLGSHICDRLLRDGHEVICLDNFYTGRRRNIMHLIDHPMFSLVEHDVTNPFCLRVDDVINMACPASPRHYQRNPVHTTKTSVLGTIHVLELAMQAGARVLHASTSEVYGDPGVHPQQESYWGNVNPIGARACYDEGKRCSETLCFDYHRRHGVPINVVRIFNTYGPRMDPNDGRVVSNFLIQAIRDEPITIYGDGSQTRSFCFVDDLVGGIMKVFDDESGLTGPVNLGNPNEITIAELAEMALSVTGSKSALVTRPLPADDPQRRCPDISLAKERLAWEPKVSLRDGLSRVAAHFENVLSNGVPMMTVNHERAKRVVA
jgi:UDP-glucuronate decarboxylase